MKKYIVTYHAPITLMQQTGESTPEEMEKGLEAWMAWAQKCGDKLVDFGTPLANGVMLKPDGGSQSSESQVCGYSILQAEDLEEAKQLLRGHPHLEWNSACAIEVHESMPTPGS